MKEFVGTKSAVGPVPEMAAYERQDVLMHCDKRFRKLFDELAYVRCHRHTEVMLTTLEACWGTCSILGVAEVGKEISTRQFQLVTGRNWRGPAFGGALGRTEVPKIIDVYMEGNIDTWQNR